MNAMPASVSPLVPEPDFLAARRGDREAFARLVRATQRTVASVALAVTRDLALSEDIAQETYLKAWQRLSTMRNAESFLPWLRQVTRNRAIDHVRRRGYQELLPGDDDARLADVPHGGPGPDGALQQEQEARLLARALDAVPDESREVLLLFYREGQSSRQVADLLGLSDGAVRKRLQRARGMLESGLLAQVGEAARHSAPGLAFTTLVVGALGPMEAGAATTATATTAKWMLGAVGSAFAAMAVVLGAVYWEVSRYVARARNPVERRELRRHGVLYAVVMASFVAMLAWSQHAGWRDGTLLAASAIFALAIVALGIRRARIHHRHRHRPDQSA